MNYTSDEDCVKRILKGDDRAFSCLIEKHKEMVFTIVIRVVENREEAEEVAQDVFLKIYHTLGSFKGMSKFSTWLYRIAYNAAISHVRKSKPNFIPLHENIQETSSGTVEVPELLEVNEEAQRREVLSQALGILKQEELLLINMHYQGQMSIEQISEVTGLSNSNTKVKLFRARKKLSETMNKLIKQKYQ